MLHYSIVFFIIAIIAAVLGFGGIAGSAAGIAKIFICRFLDLVGDITDFWQEEIIPVNQ